MTSFRLAPTEGGDHVHVRVWAGPDDDNRSLAGVLTLRRGEWDDFVGLFNPSTVLIDPLKHSGV